MASLIGTRFGGYDATVWGNPPSNAVAPAAAVIGAGATTPTSSGLSNTSPHIALYVGIAALGGLVVMRQSYPNKHDWDQDFLTIVAAYVALHVAVAGWGKRRVAEGNTSGIMGQAAEVATIAFS